MQATPQTRIRIDGGPAGMQYLRERGVAAMSLYYLQKIIYQLNRDEHVRQRYADDFESLLGDYALDEPEREALRSGDIGLLYVMGVNGQLLMHYAALRGYEWNEYLDAMRAGVERHGPVREGLYAMTDT